MCLYVKEIVLGGRRLLEDGRRGGRQCGRCSPGRHHCRPGTCKMSATWHIVDEWRTAMKRRIHFAALFRERFVGSFPLRHVFVMWFTQCGHRVFQGGWMTKTSTLCISGGWIWGKNLLPANSRINRSSSHSASPLLVVLSILSKK